MRQSTFITFLSVALATLSTASPMERRSPKPAAELLTDDPILPFTPHPYPTKPLEPREAPDFFPNEKLRKRGSVIGAGVSKGGSSGNFGSSNDYIASGKFTVPIKSGEQFSYKAASFYSAGGAEKAQSKWTVSKSSDHGKIKDDQKPWTVHRDVPCICPIGDRVFWFFDDTFVYKEDDTFVGAASNSFAVSRSSDSPSDVEEISITLEGKVTVVIPWTSEEKDIQYSSDRYAIWSYAPCIPIDDYHAAHQWTIVKFTNSSYSEILGYAMMEYEIDESTSEIAIKRNGMLTYDSGTYAYGSFASVLVNNKVYMYAVDPLSAKYDVHLAAAPRYSIYDSSTWSYYDASTSSWSQTAPDCSQRNKDSAVISGKVPFSTGSVFYSEYHQAYLMVFFSAWADSTFYAIAGDSPAGPWNTTAVKIAKTELGGNGYNYGGMATPLITGESEQGKKLVLSYTYQDTTSNWYGKTETIEFA
ncbi:uncharacterized protein V1516DRAFT_672976 [Lipomyces oligophaga]|uniref:uncharacterized protein n=1 Tax=Lipomyces oligophaga TaxID=45792 RepID=UPI0034CDF9AD